MNVHFVETGNLVLPVIDSFYSNEELKILKNELKILEKLECAQDLKNRCAVSAEKEILQKSNSRFLAHDDKENVGRKILEINRKIFKVNNLLNLLEEKSAFFKHIRMCSYDTTLINFYGADNYYKRHADESIFTVISFFELEKFSGGDFCLPEYGVRIESHDNRVVIFPGCILHEAEPIFSGTRASMAQFLNYKD